MPHRVFLYQILEGKKTELTTLKDNYTIQTCHEDKLLGFSSKVLLELILKYKDNYPFKPVTVCQTRFHKLIQEAENLNITINDIEFFNEEQDKAFDQRNHELLFTIRIKDNKKLLTLVKQYAAKGNDITSINFTIPEEVTITFTRHGEIYVDECFKDEYLLSQPSVMLLSEK